MIILLSCLQSRLKNKTRFDVNILATLIDFEKYAYTQFEIIYVALIEWHIDLSEENYYL